MNDDYRHLPRVDDLLQRYEGALPRPMLARVIREALEEARQVIATGSSVDVTTLVDDTIGKWVVSRGVRVVNASGVLLHTNLGRAAWSEESISAAERAARFATNLELDLATGERGRRGGYVSELLRTLTGADDAHVVNNNAAALVLALSALAAGRAVPVSRGELIEIGGSYRLPEVMGVSGARIVEVGTTNRTRVGDYVTALQTYSCGAVLKVHPSNYRVEGFTGSPTVSELATIAGQHGTPLIHDIGSGLLDETTPWMTPTPRWLAGEPGARQSIEAGSDLVTFSGDKLLGGPQAGIIVGTKEAVGRVRTHPLARAFRVDGVTLAALSSTLETHADGHLESIPFWGQALTPDATIRERAIRLADVIGGSTEAGLTTIGGGSAPGAGIPTTLVRLAGADHVYIQLLGADPGVLTRRESGDLLIDLRSVDPGDDDIVRTAIEQCR